MPTPRIGQKLPTISRRCTGRSFEAQDAGEVSRYPPPRTPLFAILAPCLRLQVSRRSSRLRAVFEPPLAIGAMWSTSRRSRDPQSTHWPPGTPPDFMADPFRDTFTTDGDRVATRLPDARRSSCEDDVGPAVDPRVPAAQAPAPDDTAPCFPGAFRMPPAGFEPATPGLGIRPRTSLERAMARVFPA